MDSETKKSVVITTFFIAITTIATTLLRGIPWLISLPNWPGILLFNHEVTFLPASQTVLFFNPSNVHTFFPFSYIFSRILFLQVPNPLLDEFIMPVIMEFVLLFLLTASWLRNRPASLSYFVIFAIGCLSLYIFTSVDQYVWFDSIGL